ncbi:hypothetical protein [Stenotrophomonas sp. DR822]|uniref:hypothetical protein n=1 Tax=Stenotrophomonas sp. DR822 TaxID=2871174 RepID=UPI0021BBE34B|nr:hypothetical protein [Stenotrophomonas sp. DR822]
MRKGDPQRLRSTQLLLDAPIGDITDSAGRPQEQIIPPEAITIFGGLVQAKQFERAVSWSARFKDGARKNVHRHGIEDVLPVK